MRFIKNLNKKYTAAVIIFTVLFGIFMPFANVSVSAEFDDNVTDALPAQVSPFEEKTRIKSVIPYVEKNENGIKQTVPVESREDMELYTRITLRIRVYIGPEEKQQYYGKPIYIFKLQPYEETSDINKEGSFYESSFIVDEKADYDIDLYSPDLSKLENGEIFNKFVAAIEDPNSKDPNKPEYIPVTDAKYIDNINCLSNKKHTPPVSKTKKGLAVQMPGEARMLGVGYTAINILLNDFMSAEDGLNIEVYKYDDEDFYFNIDKISEYDKKIKYFTNEGINVTAVLLISAWDFVPSGSQSNDDNNGETGEDSGGSGDSDNSDDNNITQSIAPRDPIEYLIHPNALYSTDSIFYYGINMADEKGARYFEALMSFIADRYVEKDRGYGRIYNIILGNQIGRHTSNNYCGKTDMLSYVKNYMRALRICDTAMRSRFGGSRVYVPFDNWFAETPEDGNFKNKNIIDLLCDYSVKEGNFIWNVAFMPYNLDRSNPEYWKESLPANDFSTPIITMKNIEVLCNYINLEKKDYLPGGEIRKVMISDLGYSSGDNSKEEMEMQAAAFICAYIKVRSIPDITAFIYHGHVDKNEVGALGLWTKIPDTENDPWDKKKIYDVFKYMDTNREHEKIEFAKSIPGADDEIAKYPKETEPAIILKEVTGETLKSNPNATLIGGFNDDRLSGFIASSNISTPSKVLYDNKDSDKFYRTNTLFTGFSNPVKGDFGGIFKTYTPDDLLDLTGEKYVGVKLRIDTSVPMPEDRKIQLVLIMESEPASQSSGIANETGGMSAVSETAQNPGNTAKTISVFEGLANISPNKDEIIYFDISDWEDKTDIKKIKLLVNPYFDSDINIENSNTAGKYDFNLYVNSIVSAHNSRMSGLQTFIIVILVIVIIAVAGYGALYIRARIIKKKRRELRELKRKKAQAAAGRTQGSSIPGYSRTMNYNLPQNQQQRQRKPDSRQGQRKGEPRPPNGKNKNNNKSP